MAQLVYLVVDLGVFFYICVSGWHIGLRLIIVVVGDKILHCVLGEELLELAVKLRRQRLVVGNDQRGSLHPLNDVGHGEGLAGAGDAH